MSYNNETQLFDREPLTKEDIKRAAEALNAQGILQEMQRTFRERIADRYASFRGREITMNNESILRLAEQLMPLFDDQLKMLRDRISADPLNRNLEERYNDIVNERQHFFDSYRETILEQDRRSREQAVLSGHANPTDVINQIVLASIEIEVIDPDELSAVERQEHEMFRGQEVDFSAVRVKSWLQEDEGTYDLTTRFGFNTSTKVLTADYKREDDALHSSTPSLLDALAHTERATSIYRLEQLQDQALSELREYFEDLQNDATAIAGIEITVPEIDAVDLLEDLSSDQLRVTATRTQNGRVQQVTLYPTFDRREGRRSLALMTKGQNGETVLLRNARAIQRQFEQFESQEIEQHEYQFSIDISKTPTIPAARDIALIEHDSDTRLRTLINQLSRVHRTSILPHRIDVRHYNNRAPQRGQIDLAYRIEPYVVDHLLSIHQTNRGLETTINGVSYLLYDRDTFDWDQGSLANAVDQVLMRHQPDTDDKTLQTLATRLEGQSFNVQGEDFFLHSDGDATIQVQNDHGSPISTFNIFEQRGRDGKAVFEIALPGSHGSATRVDLSNTNELLQKLQDWAIKEKLSSNASIAMFQQALKDVQHSERGQKAPKQNIAFLRAILSLFGSAHITGGYMHTPLASIDPSDIEVKKHVHLQNLEGTHTKIVVHARNAANTEGSAVVPLTFYVNEADGNRTLRLQDGRAFHDAIPASGGTPSTSALSAIQSRLQRTFTLDSEEQAEVESQIMKPEVQGALDSTSSFLINTNEQIGVIHAGTTPSSSGTPASPTASFQYAKNADGTLLFRNVSTGTSTPFVEATDEHIANAIEKLQGAKAVATPEENRDAILPLLQTELLALPLTKKASTEKRDNEQRIYDIEVQEDGHDIYLSAMYEDKTIFYTRNRNRQRVKERDEVTQKPIEANITLSTPVGTIITLTLDSETIGTFDSSTNSLKLRKPIITRILQNHFRP